MIANPIRIALFFSLALAYSCSSKDSTDKAQQMNEERIDKQAVAVSTDAKDDAKKVTASMVELANTSLIELELSKVAVQKATNPEVKNYARQALNDHTQDERDLRNLAKQMNVTLPVELSKAGGSNLGKLNEMRTGTEFDTQYLDYMVSANDDALDAADDLADDAPTDAVKTFAKKILDDDKKHKERARQLKNVLD